MSSSAVITARVDPALVARLDTLAAKLERSRAWVVSRAISRYVEEELEFLAFVQVGIDDLEAGRTHPQEEVEARFEIDRASRNAA